MTSTNTSQTTDSISKSGSFLQIHVTSELEKKSWSVFPEFPVQAAPFIAGPIKHPVHPVDLSLHKTI